MNLLLNNYTDLKFEDVEFITQNKVNESDIESINNSRNNLCDLKCLKNCSKEEIMEAGEDWLRVSKKDSPMYARWKEFVREPFLISLKYYLKTRVDFSSAEEERIFEAIGARFNS